MAVEKGLILTAINKKFGDKSVSKIFKENVATIWAGKIVDESEIDSFIEENSYVILQASTEADTRVTDAVKKLTTSKTEGNPEIKTDEFKVADDTPEWAKALIAQNKTLSDKINGFETQQTQKTLTERFKSHPELKGIPEFMFKGRIPTTEEEIETAVAELKTDYSTFATENKLSILGSDVPNTGGGKNSNEVKPASKEDVDKIFNNINRI